MAEALVTYDLPGASSVQRTLFNDALGKTAGWKKLGELTTAWRVVFPASRDDQSMRNEILSDLQAAKRAANLQAIVYAAGVGGVVTHARA